MGVGRGVAVTVIKKVDTVVRVKGKGVALGFRLGGGIGGGGVG